MYSAPVMIADYQAVENFQWREEQRSLSHALAQARSPQERDEILAQSDRGFSIRCLDCLFFMVAVVAIVLGSCFWAYRHTAGLTEMHTTGGIVLFALLGVCVCWFTGREYNLMDLTSFVVCACETTAANRLLTGLTMWRIGPCKKASRNQSRNTSSQGQDTSTLASGSPPPYPATISIGSSSFDYNPAIHGNILPLPKLVYDRRASAWTQHLSTDRGYTLYSGVIPVSL